MRLSKLLGVLPVRLQHKIMTKMIVDNYAVNNYNARKRNENTRLDEKQEQIIDEFLSHVCSQKHVLDIGCGNARLYDTVLAGKGCTITGVDISEKQIECAKTVLPGHEFVVSDFMQYKPEESFDAITSFFSLYNIPRRMHRKLLRLCYSWLKPHGRMLINVRVDGVGAVDYWKDWCGAPLVFSYYSAKTFKKIARSVGFYVTQFHATHNPEYVWLILSVQPDLPKFL